MGVQRCVGDEGQEADDQAGHHQHRRRGHPHPAQRRDRQQGDGGNGEDDDQLSGGHTPIVPARPRPLGVTPLIPGQLRALSQYRSGGSASRPSRSRTSAGTDTPRALMLLRNCATVAAPLSTTSTHGRARTPASASASAAAPARPPPPATGARRRAGQPAVGQRLLDDHAHAGVVGRLQRRAGRRLQQVPRRLHGVEAADLERTLDRLAPAWRSGRRSGRSQSPRIAAGPARPGTARSLEDTALERRRVDLIEPQVGAEVVPSLGILAGAVSRARSLTSWHLGVNAASPAV